MKKYLILGLMAVGTFFALRAGAQTKEGRAVKAKVKTQVAKKTKTAKTGMHKAVAAAKKAKKAVA